MSCTTDYYTPAPRILRTLRLFWRAVFFIVATGALAATGGCSYKSEIRQGNDTLPDKIGELKLGMTREEVRELLGKTRTPEVFATDEWIYYYRWREAGFFPKTRTWGVVLEFDGDALAVIRPLAGDDPAVASDPEEEVESESAADSEQEAEQ